MAKRTEAQRQTWPGNLEKQGQGPEGLELSGADLRLILPTQEVKQAKVEDGRQGIQRSAKVREPVNDWRWIQTHCPTFLLSSPDKDGQGFYFTWKGEWHGERWSHTNLD